MRMSYRVLSVVLLLSVTLGGCKATETPQSESAAAQTRSGSQSTLVHISSEAQFNQLIAQGNVCIDFFAPWCGPCKEMSRTLDQLVQEVSGVTFVKVDTTQFGSLARQYGVQSIPTLFFFKDGNQLSRISGSVTKAALRGEIQRLYGE